MRYSILTGILYVVEEKIRDEVNILEIGWSELVNILLKFAFLGS